MRNYVVILLAANFLNLSIITAEPTGGGHAGDETSSSTGEGERQKAEQTQLKNKELKRMEHYSGIDSEALKDLFNKTLPDAITQAIEKKDYSALGADTAKFAGYLNKEQLEFMRDDAKKQAEEETGKGEKRDQRYITLMEGLSWIAKARLKQDPETPDEEKFAQAAKEGISKAEQEKSSTWDKVKLAASGDKNAKTWLRDKVNRKALLSYLRAQMKSGTAKDRERATTIAKALAWEENKKNYLDTNGPGGTPRFWIGETDEQIQKSFELADNEGLLRGQSLAKVANKEPSSDFSVKDGQLAEAVPNGIKPRVKKTAVATEDKLNPKVEALTNFVSASCNVSSCHSSTVVRQGSSVLIQRNNEPPISLAAALNAVKGGGMIDEGPAMAQFESLIQQLDLTNL